MSAATASRSSLSNSSANAAPVFTRPHRRFADAEGFSEQRSSGEKSKLLWEGGKRKEKRKREEKRREEKIIARGGGGEGKVI